MTVSNKSLDQLEARVTQVVQLVSSLQTEKKALEEEVEKLKKLRRNVEEVKKDNSTRDQLIKQFKNDRLRIRSRVEKIAEKVVALEEFS